MDMNLLQSALAVRIISVILIISILLYSLYKNHLKDTGVSKRIWRHKLLYEFILPFLILFVLLIIEILLVEKEKYHINIKSTVDWLLVLEFGKKLLLEILPIFLTFFLFYYFSIRAEWKKENKISNNLWDNFYNILNERKEDGTIDIKALNVNDFRLFFHPLGFRYFLEIANSTKKTNGEKKRIIVFDCKDYEDLCNLRMINDSLKNNDRLNDDERIFYNICQLHKINEIDLYLVPKGEILKLLYNNKHVLNFADNKLKNETNTNIHKNFYWILRFPYIVSLIIIVCIRFIIAPIINLFSKLCEFLFNLINSCSIYGFRNYFKKLDSVIINDCCYYPTEYNKNFVLHKRNVEYKNFVDNIFKRFTNNCTSGAKSKYHVESIKEYITKK